jgi:hypothetical protein
MRAVAAMVAPTIPALLRRTAPRSIVRMVKGSSSLIDKP